MSLLVVLVLLSTLFFLHAIVCMKWIMTIDWLLSQVLGTLLVLGRVLGMVGDGEVEL